jgi:outer membrane receptor protein involved in Fe transport
MYRFAHNFILTAIPLLLLAVKAADCADSYTLKGRTVRAESKESVAGVLVHLLETGTKAVTDMQGRFTLENLKPGRYTFAITHPQYLDQRIVLQIPLTADLEIGLRTPPRYNETVTVTATPWAVDRADLAQSASVLYTGEVRARSGPSVGEAISSLPGVRSVSTGEAGGAPMIRGQTNERIRVLSNGFPHDYYQFSRRHMPNVETYDSNSIEVIRGPASVLYGTQAMGGLTNLVSAPIPKAEAGRYIFRGEGLLGYAANNAAKAGHAQIEGAIRNLGARAAWTQRAADDISTPGGDLPNTDYDQRAVLLEIGYRPSTAFSVRSQYRHWQNDLGFYIPPQPDFGLDLANDMAELEALIGSGWGEWHISGNVSRNERRAFPGGRSKGANINLRLLTQSYRASFQHKPSGPFRGWLQLEYSRQRNNSFGPVTLVPNYQNRTWAAAVFEEIRLVSSKNLDRLVLNLGLRYDNRSLKVPAISERGIPDEFIKDYAPMTGSVSAVYRFDRAFSVGLSISRGWRNPSEYELFAEGPHDGALLYERGNPALQEETNRNLEFTLRLEKRKVRGFLAMFHSKFDNYIYQKLSGEIQDELPVGVYSQSDAILKGLEGQISIDTTKWLTLSVSGDMLATKNLATGTRLPFSPPDRAIVSAHLHSTTAVDWIHPFIEIKSILTRNGRISGPEEPFPLDTAGYMLLDLGAGIQRRVEKGILAFDLWISNLADRAYKDFLDTYKLYALSPGRNIRATLRFLF